MLIFWNKLPPKRILSVKKRKHKYLYLVLHIEISLSTKFQLKLAIFFLWTKFAQKEYFHLKTEKVNITIEFCILEMGMFWFFFWLHIFGHVQIMKNQVFCSNFSCVNICEIGLCHLLHLFIRYTIYHFLHWKQECQKSK